MLRLELDLTGDDTAGYMPMNAVDICRKPLLLGPKPGLLTPFRKPQLLGRRNHQVLRVHLLEKSDRSDARGAVMGNLQYFSL